MADSDMRRLLLPVLRPARKLVASASQRDHCQCLAEVRIHHGTRSSGREPGRFEPAGLIVTSWLQGTSRDGDP